MNIAAQGSTMVRQALRAVSATPSPDNFKATVAALQGFQLDNADAVRVDRDLAYGSDARQVFDWFEPVQLHGDAPLKVLLFVHGGGFVGGAKREPHTPLYDNIGLWAASHGLGAATINYRLAPGHQWPAGGDDVLLASRQIATHARQLARRQIQLYLMGHSAGAVHVATAITQGPAPVDVCGAILISGFYNNTVGKPSTAYFGERPELHEAQSSLKGLALTDVPLFIAVAEHDPQGIQAHAAAVVKARSDTGKPPAQFAVLDGNNHYSTMLLPNSSIDFLGPRILEFISRPISSPRPTTN